MSRIGGQMALGDRIRTVVVTALLTSLGWLAFGGGVVRDVGNLFALRKEPAAMPARIPAEPAAQTASVPPATRPSPPPPAARAVSGGYIIPVAGIRPEALVDTFSAARSGGRVHDAIDIMAPRGTPVIAAIPGKVERLFTSKLGGLTIYVRSEDRRTITYYAHLDAYASGLVEGQSIRQGQQIGTVGFTGNADPAAPHLHFAIMQTTAESTWWEPSLAINPYPLLAGKRR